MKSMNESQKRLVHLLIGIIIFAVCRLIFPMDSGLTPAGANFLAVFIATAYLWCVAGSDWVSTLSIFMIIALGTMPYNQALSLSYGSFLMPMLVAFFILSNAMGNTGLMQKIARWFISRKIVEGHPYIFLLMFNLACLIITAISSMMVGILLFMDLAAEIGDDLGYKKEDGFYRAMTLATLWNSIVGEGIGAIGKGGYLTMLSVMSGFGIDVPLLKYLLCSIPLAVVYLIVLMLITRFVVNPDTANYVNYDAPAMRKIVSETKLSAKAHVTAVVYCIVVLALLLPSLGIPVISAYLSKISATTIPVLAVLFLSLCPIGETPVLNFSEEVQKVNWPIILFSGGIIMYSSAMALPDLGVSTMFTNLLAPLTEVLSPMIIALVGIAIAGILTNVVSNLVMVSVTCVAFTPVLISTFESGVSTVNPAAFAVCVSIISYMAFITPSASAIAPIILGNTLTVKQGFVPSTLLVLCMIFAVFGVCLPIGNLVFA